MNSTQTSKRASDDPVSINLVKKKLRLSSNIQDCPTAMNDDSSEDETLKLVDSYSDVVPQPSRQYYPGSAIKGARSYYRSYQNEKSVAAYCGFSTVAKFRKFLMSYPVLEAFTYFESVTLGVADFQWETLFNMVINMSNEAAETGTDMFDEHWGPSVDITKEYDILSDDDDDEMTQKEDSMMAAGFYRMLKSIEGYDQISPEIRKSRTDTARKEFYKHFLEPFAQEMPAGRPVFDTGTISMAKLGPFVCLGEDYLEPYSRLFAVISVLSKHLSSSQLEFNKFIASETPYSNTKLLRDKEKPYWMNVVSKEARALAKATDEETDKLRSDGKKFKVRWVMSKNDEDAKAHIAKHELDLEITRKQNSSEDPRLMGGGQYRDSIKHQFRLLKMPGGKKFGFLRMMLRYTDEDGEKENIDMIERDWLQEIQPLLRTKPSEDLEIMFWVRLLDDNEASLEFSETPGSSRGMMELDENGLPMFRAQ